MKMSKVLCASLLLLGGVLHAGTKNFTNKLDQTVIVTLESQKDKGSVKATLTLAPNATGTINYDAVNAISLQVTDSNKKNLGYLRGCGKATNCSDPLNSNKNFTISMKNNKVDISGSN